MQGLEEQSDEPGPFKLVRAFGRDIPYYVIRFDRDGACISPRSADHLLERVAAEPFSHVLLYSHGWNNDFPSATQLYDRFLTGLSDIAATHPVLPAIFSPVFVGVAWPSTALTFGAEDGPEIAAAGADAEEVDSLLEALPAERRAQAAAILGNVAVPMEDALTLAAWVADAQQGGSDEEVAPGAPDADEIVEGWVAAQAAFVPSGGGDGFKNFGPAPGAPVAADGPQAAGWPQYLDPRWIVRLATVLTMKDRAGVVGANGVADLVGRLLAETDAALYLFGHSYGCKVVMTALATLSAGAPRRKVAGALLLQPAISWLCFAADIGDGVEGGFTRTLPLLAKPVLATHSNRDFPLTQVFHLVARRSLDAGELQFAGPPSRFAALGGYGAGECAPNTSVDVALPAVGHSPDLPATARVVSLDGSASIGGHGDVNRAETFWAALNLLK